MYYTISIHVRLFRESNNTENIQMIVYFIQKL